MNERIKELAKQAGGNPNYKAFFGHFLPPPPDYIDPATVDLEKFAELIVKECANKMLELAQQFETPVAGYEPVCPEFADGNINGLKEGAELVMQHFGVE